MYKHRQIAQNYKRCTLVLVKIDLYAWGRTSKEKDYF